MLERLSEDETGERSPPTTNLMAVPHLSLPGNMDGGSGVGPGPKLSHRSIRNLVTEQMQHEPKLDSNEPVSPNSSLLEEKELTVLRAFSDRIIEDCMGSALGTALMAEMQRFIEVLDLYKPVADFPI